MRKHAHRKWLFRSLPIILLAAMTMFTAPTLSQKSGKPRITAVPNPPSIATAEQVPFEQPTETPVEEPTEAPTDEPTAAPTEAPTSEPTQEAQPDEEIILTVEPELTPTPAATDDRESPLYTQTFCLMQITNANDTNPFTFRFQAINPSNIATFTWDFDTSDGVPGTTTGVGPHTHTYTTTGTFPVQLTCTPQAGFGSDLVLTGSITVAPVAVVNFELTAPGITANGVGGYNILGLAPVTVGTVNQSSTHQATYAWSVDQLTPSFVDNVCTGTSANITCPLTEYGNYEFRLDVTVGTGPLAATGSMTRQVVLNAPAPEWDFTYSPVSGEGPLTVTFEPINLGAGPTTAVEFDFDFNTTFNPTLTVLPPYDPFTHVFPAPAVGDLERIYTVRMRYTGPGGVGFVQKQVVVVEPEAELIANFTAELTGNNPGGQIEVCFTNTSSGPFVESEWDFDGLPGTGNDGYEEVDNDSPICRLYPPGGTITVRLRVSDLVGYHPLDEATAQATRPVALVAAPVAAFTVNPGTSITLGTLLNLNASTSISPSIIDIYEWDLDADGEFDDATGVTHNGLNIPTTGIRPIRLRVTGPGGSSIAEQIIVVSYREATCAITGPITVTPGATNPNYTFTTGNMQGRTVTAQAWRAVPATGPAQTGTNNSFTLDLGSGTAPYTITIDLTLSDGSICTANATVNVFHPPIVCTISAYPVIPGTLYPNNFNTTFAGGVTGVGSRTIVSQTTTLFRGPDPVATDPDNTIDFTNVIDTTQTFPIQWRVRFEVTLSDGTTCFDEVTFQTSPYPSATCSVSSGNQSPNTNGGSNTGIYTYTVTINNLAGRNDPAPVYTWSTGPNGTVLPETDSNPATRSVQWAALASPTYSYSSYVDATVLITNADGTTILIDCNQRNVNPSTPQLSCAVPSGDITPVVGETNTYTSSISNIIGRTMNNPPGIQWTLTRTDVDPDEVVMTGTGATFQYQFTIPGATYTLGYTVSYGSDADPNINNFPYDDCAAQRNLVVTSTGVGYTCDAFTSSGGFNNFSPNNASGTFSYRVNMDNGNRYLLNYRYVLVGPDGTSPVELGDFDSDLDGNVPFPSAFSFATLRPYGVGTYTMHVYVTPADGETSTSHECSFSNDLLVGAMDVTYTYTIDGGWNASALPIDTNICIVNASTATGDTTPPAASSLYYDWSISGPAGNNSLGVTTVPAAPFGNTDSAVEISADGCINFNTAGSYTIRLNGASSRPDLAFGMEDWHEVTFNVYDLQSIAINRHDGNQFVGSTTQWSATWENLFSNQFQWSLTRPNGTTVVLSGNSDTLTTGQLNDDGTYTMTVRGNGNLGYIFASAQFTLLPADQLRASFIRTPGAGLAPLHVCFTDTSASGTPIEIWEWDFDGDFSVDQTFTSPQAPGSICYTYPTAGMTYLARLTVYNENYDDSATNRIRVLSLADLSGNFSIAYQGGGEYCYTPVSMSPGAVAYEWDYGDGDGTLVSDNGTVCHVYAFNTDPLCFHTVTMYFTAPDGTPAEVSKDIPCMAPSGTPNLEMVASCSTDRVATFRVTNNGSPMSIADEIVIRDANDEIVLVAPVQLAGGGAWQEFTVNDQIGTVTAALTNAASVTANTLCVEYTFSAACDALNHLPIFTVSKNPASAPTAGQTFTITNSDGVVLSNSWTLEVGVGSIDIAVPLGNNPYDIYEIESNGALGDYSAEVGPCAPPPTLFVTGICRTNAGDAEAGFTVTNNGGLMLESQPFTITGSISGPILSGDLDLAAGGSVDLIVPANIDPYQTFTLESDGFAATIDEDSTCVRPDLDVEGVCRTNSTTGDAEVGFTVTNNGGPMLELQAFFITGSVEGLVLSGFISPAANASITMIVPASFDPYQTFTLESDGFAATIDEDHNCLEPSLNVEGVCRTNSTTGDAEVGFTVTNNGGPMLEPQAFTIFSGATLALNGNIFLDANASIDLIVPSANDPYATYTLMSSGFAATIDEDHNCQRPNLSVEGVCRTNSTTGDAEVGFTVTNNGGPMLEPQAYMITGAVEGLVLSGDLNLGAGGSAELIVPTTFDPYQTFTLESDGFAGTVDRDHTCLRPALAADGVCRTNSTTGDAEVGFTVTNNGGPMLEPQAFTITGAVEGLVLSGDLNLGAGGTVELIVPTAEDPYDTYTFATAGFAGTISESDPCLRPVIEATGICRTANNDAEVGFTVVNNGGPMLEPQAFTITGMVEGLVLSGDLNLVAGGSVELIVPTAEDPYDTYTFATAGFASTYTRDHTCQRPVLVATGVCRVAALDAQVGFTVTNNGGPMLEPQAYVVTGGAAPLNGDLMLAAGGSQEIIAPTTDNPYATYSLTSSGFASTVQFDNTCPQPAINVTAVCSTNLSDSEAAVGFRVMNGDAGGAMLEPQAYTISNSGGVVSSGTFYLVPGAYVNLFVPNNLNPYSVYTFETNGFAATLSPSNNCGQPALSATGTCDTPRTFTVTNIGAEMLEAQAYTISRDGMTVLTGSLDLNAGQTNLITLPGDIDPYGTYVFETDGFAGETTAVRDCEYPVMTVNNTCGYPMVLTVTNNGGPTLQAEPWQITDPAGAVVMSGATSWPAGGSVDITLVGLSPYVSYAFSTTGFTDAFDVDNYVPCSAPALTAEYTCGVTPSFTVTNTGADMIMPQTLRISSGGDVLLEQPLQLASGASEVFTLADANPYLTYTLTTSDGYTTQLSVTGSCGTPELTVEAICGTPASFLVTNTGADMIVGHGYRILNGADNAVLASGGHQLAGGETTAINLPVDIDTSGSVVFVSNDYGVSAEAVLQCSTVTDRTPRGTGEFVGVESTPPAGLGAPGCGRGCPVFKLYHTDEVGGWEIFRLDGSDEETQTSIRANLSFGLDENVASTAPSLSPDNQWIVFSSDRDGNWELYVAPTSGGGPESVERVTYNTVAIDSDPVWGPGNFVVFETTRHGTWDLYAIDMTTGVEFRLTNGEGNDINPYWSADGSRMVFQSDRPDEDGVRKWQIYELDLGTLALNKLSDGTAIDVDPEYSNNGGKIAFRSYGAEGDRSQLSLMNVDGTGRTAFSDPAGDATNAAWSPSDTYIAYQSNLDGDLDIYVYEVATGITRHLTDNAIADYAPTWLCDDVRVVWTSDIMGDANLFEATVPPITAEPILVDPDADQLTFEVSSDIYPLSSPSEENASREGLTVRGAFGTQTVFLEPLVSLTPIDLSNESITRTEWQPINVCPANTLLGGG